MTTTAPATPPLRLAGIAKTYGAVRALDNLDLTMAAGEVVALLGPNGAGKSTTVDLLLGLAQPDAGTVELFGGSPRAATTAGRVGAMLQTGGLLGELTVRELVDLLRGLYPAPLPTAAVLERAGIADLAGRRTETLSGGQTQRVRFACAILPDPDLLVLDEPTVAMDVEARHAFWDSMRAEAAAGRTVLFATHYLEEADAFADRIVLLRGGRVVADGSTAAIKSRVAGRTVSATVPGLADADLARLGRLPGVAAADRQGARLVLRCPDSDTALRALLTACPAAYDIEIAGSNLEEAFLALTSDSAPTPTATTIPATTSTPPGTTPTAVTSAPAPTPATAGASR